MALIQATVTMFEFFAGTAGTGRISGDLAPGGWIVRIDDRRRAVAEQRAMDLIVETAAGG
jgi:hypothetical protein